MNLFATILTYTAPSANYRGESAENRAVIQKITKGRHDYAVISPEAMRNAVREGLREIGLPCNRKRLHDEEQLAVEFSDYPDDSRFADDFFMGWLVAATGKDRKSIKKELTDKGRDAEAFTFKRDSVLRMNLAMALEPYRHNTIFTQSPRDASDAEAKRHKNDDSSNLLHRETTVTAFQYPFALNLNDCKKGPADWTRGLLRVIGELGGVAGNHARSYYEMAPASVVVRLTPQLVAGFDTYGFKVKDETHKLPEIVEGIVNGDYPGDEFYLGGKLVRDMDESTRKALEDKGSTLERNPQKLLQIVADKAL